MKIDDGKTVMPIEDDVRGEQRDQWQRKFVFRWQVGGAAKNNGSDRCEVRQPAGAGCDQEPRRNTINDGRDDKQNRGNHLQDFICPAPSAKGIWNHAFGLSRSGQEEETLNVQRPTSNRRSAVAAAERLMPRL